MFRSLQIYVVHTEKHRECHIDTQQHRHIEHQLLVGYQAAICVFDCSMASGQVIPTKKATSTEIIIISFTPWKVCFSTKPLSLLFFAASASRICSTFC